MSMGRQQSEASRRTRDPPSAVKQECLASSPSLTDRPFFPRLLYLQ